MKRVKWKGPFVDKSLINDAKSKKYFEIKTTSRKTIVISSFIGKTFSVHNGKTFFKFEITEGMVGHKFGEFSPTRKAFTFKKKKKTK